MERFLALVDTSYTQFEENRQMVERTLELSSQELNSSNQELRRQKAELEEAYEELVQTRNELTEAQRIAELSTELEAKNRELLAATANAKRIQEALLGSQDGIQMLFPESFIYFEPRDGVSGDFYWYTWQGDSALLVAGDCTGHGISGAFLTVLGINVLNEVVKLHGITSPSKILSHADSKIIDLLNKENEALAIHEGIDMAVLRFCGKTLSYAGAKIPLAMIREQQLQMTEASPFTIGSTQLTQEKVFAEHHFELERNTVCYLFSDGYRDQIGGPNLRKMMKSPFLRLLQDIHTLPLRMQKQYLADFMDQWRGEVRQMDDMLIIGIKGGAIFSTL